VDGLSGLKNLETLDLRGCSSLRGVDGLSGLTNLKTLNLRECSSLTGVDGLSGLTSLQTLYLNGCNALSPGLSKSYRSRAEVEALQDRLGGG
jgi:Leucine-rich repeat (LRR) protein